MLDECIIALDKFLKLYKVNEPRTKKSRFTLKFSEKPKNIDILLK